MGMTPLEGLAMGTRSGDIDPAIIEFICQKENISVSDMTMILNKKSGVLGLSGVSNDLGTLLMHLKAEMKMHVMHLMYLFTE